jgi:hypothetical protein
MAAAAPTTDPETTAANRRGEMTPEQRQSMAASLKAATPFLVLVGCLRALFLFTLLILLGTNTFQLLVPASAAVFSGLTALILFYGVWSGLLLARALREVRAGRVEQASGQVDDYHRASVPGRKLDLAGLNLAAGTYEFYYLPGSGRVVAAELLAAEVPAQTQAQLLHTLAVTNGFNVDWLPDFRQGRLGAGREGRLRRIWSSTGWTLVAAVVVLAVFVFLVNANPNSRLLTYLAVGAMVLAIGVLVSALGAIQPTLDVLAGRVVSAGGPVQKVQRETHGRSASVYCFYQIGNQLWPVSREAYRALVDGERYRIYYLPHAKP